MLLEAAFPLGLDHPFPGLFFFKYIGLYLLHRDLLPPGHGCKRGCCISTWLWAEPGEKEPSSAFSCALSYSKPRCKENFAGLCFNLLLRESPEGLEVVVVGLGVVKDVASASTRQELVWDHADAERKSRLLLFSRIKTPNYWTEGGCGVTTQLIFQALCWVRSPFLLAPEAALERKPRRCT